jgi:hypothetical protein
MVRNIHRAWVAASSASALINLPFNNPHSYAIIPASGGHELAVRAEGNGCHRTGMSCKCIQRLRLFFIIEKLISTKVIRIFCPPNTYRSTFDVRPRNNLC